MEVPDERQRRGKQVDEIRNHPGLFGPKLHSRDPAAQFKEGHARVGLKPEDEPDATPADSCCRGEHHVRTLYGEGTARDLLRAV